MIVFEVHQRLMMVFGYLFTITDRPWYRIYGVFINMLVFLPLIPMTLYIFRHIKDFEKVSPSMTLGFAVVSAVFKGSVLMKRRDCLKSLLIELQQNIHLQNSDKMHNFIAMDQLGQRLTRVCIVITVSCAIALFGGPLAIVALHYFRGSLKEEMWIQPVLMV